MMNPGMLRSFEAIIQRLKAPSSQKPKIRTEADLKKASIGKLEEKTAYYQGYTQGGVEKTAVSTRLLQNPMNLNINEIQRRALNTIGPGGVALLAGGAAAATPYVAKWGLKKLLPEKGSKELQMPSWMGGEEIPVSREDVDDIPGWWFAAPMGLGAAVLAAANYGRTLRNPEAKGFFGGGNIGDLHAARRTTT